MRKPNKIIEEDLGPNASLEVRSKRVAMVEDRFMDSVHSAYPEVLLVSWDRQSGKTTLIRNMVYQLICDGYDKPIVVVVNSLGQKLRFIEMLDCKSDKLVVLTNGQIKSSRRGVCAGVLFIDDVEHVDGYLLRTKFGPMCAWHNASILMIGTECGDVL